MATQRTVSVTRPSERLLEHKKTLLEVIDCDDVFLAQLRAAGAIIERIYDDISKENSNYMRNESLLQILTCLDIYNDVVHPKFMYALSTDYQEHVANLLESQIGQYQNTGPLPLEHAVREHIARVKPMAAGEMHLDPSFLAALRSKQVILERHEAAINQKPSMTHKSICLINIVLRRSDQAHKDFLECLQKTGQNSAADLLQITDGKVVTVHVMLPGGEDDAVISDQTNEFIMTPDSCSVGKAILQRLKDFGLFLCGTRPSDSISFFIICNNEQAFKTFCKLEKSGKLEEILNELINAVVSPKPPFNISIKLDDKEFESCRKYFAEQHGAEMSPMDDINAEETPKKGSLSLSLSLISGKRYALLVGINKNRKKPLQGCLNDIARVKNLLSQPQFLLSSCEVISESVATKPYILNRLRHYADITHANDSFLFWFSGHGSQLSNPDKHNGTNETFVALDTYEKDDKLCQHHITDDELARILRSFGSRNIALVFDSCHSTDMSRHMTPKSEVSESPSPASSSQSQSLSPLSVESIRCLPRVETGKQLNDSSGSDSCKKILGKKDGSGWGALVNLNYVLLSACLDTEDAAESIMDVGGKKVMHGVLTHHVCEYLENLRQDQLSGLTWRMLYHNMWPRSVADRWRLQQPQLEGLRDLLFLGSQSVPAVNSIPIALTSSGNYCLVGGSAHGIGCNSTWQCNQQKEAAEMNCTFISAASDPHLNVFMLPLKLVAGSSAPPNGVALTARCMSSYFQESVRVCISSSGRSLPLDSSSSPSTLTRILDRLEQSPYCETLPESSPEAAEFCITIHHDKEQVSVSTAGVIPPPFAGVFLMTSVNQLDLFLSNCEKLFYWFGLQSRVQKGKFWLDSFPSKDVEPAMCIQLLAYDRNVASVSTKNIILRMDSVTPLAEGMLPDVGDPYFLQITNNFKSMMYITWMEFGAACAVRILYPPPGAHNTAIAEKSSCFSTSKSFSIGIPRTALFNERGVSMHTWRFIFSTLPVDFTVVEQDGLGLFVPQAIDPTRVARGDEMDRDVKFTSSRPPPTNNGFAIVDFLFELHPTSLNSLMLALSNNTKWSTEFDDQAVCALLKSLRFPDNQHTLAGFRHPLNDACASLNVSPTGECVPIVVRALGTGSSPGPLVTTQLEVYLVCGFDGADDTWTNREKISWPQWMQKDELIKAQVKTVECCSSGNHSIDQLSDQLSQLLFPMEAASTPSSAPSSLSTSAPMPSRRVVWLCHGKGGLLIKHLLVKNNSIADKTLGIVFYGTDHAVRLDSNLHALTSCFDWRLRAQNNCWQQYQREVRNLHQKFVRLLHRRIDQQQPLHLLSFIESLKTGLCTVVSERDACPDDLDQHHTICRLQSNHIELCQPADHFDLMYTTLMLFLYGLLDTNGRMADDTNKSSVNNGQGGGGRLDGANPLAASDPSSATSVAANVEGTDGSSLHPVSFIQPSSVTGTRAASPQLSATQLQKNQLQQQLDLLNERTIEWEKQAYQLSTTHSKLLTESTIVLQQLIQCCHNNEPIGLSDLLPTVTKIMILFHNVQFTCMYDGVIPVLSQAIVQIQEAQDDAQGVAAVFSPVGPSSSSSLSVLSFLFAPVPCDTLRTLLLGILRLGRSILALATGSNNNYMEDYEAAFKILDDPKYAIYVSAFSKTLLWAKNFLLVYTGDTDAFIEGLEQLMTMAIPSYSIQLHSLFPPPHLSGEQLRRIVLVRQQLEMLNIPGKQCLIAILHRHSNDITTALQVLKKEILATTILKRNAADQAGTPRVCLINMANYLFELRDFPQSYSTYLTAIDLCVPDSSGVIDILRMLPSVGLCLLSFGPSYVDSAIRLFQLAKNYTENYFRILCLFGLTMAAGDEGSLKELLNKVQVFMQGRLLSPLQQATNVMGPTEIAIRAFDVAQEFYIRNKRPMRALACAEYLRQLKPTPVSAASPPVPSPSASGASTMSPSYASVSISDSYISSYVVPWSHMLDDSVCVYYSICCNLLTGMHIICYILHKKQDPAQCTIEVVTTEVNSHTALFQRQVTPDTAFDSFRDLQLYASLLFPPAVMAAIPVRACAMYIVPQGALFALPFGEMEVMLAGSQQTVRLGQRFRYCLLLSISQLGHERITMSPVASHDSSSSAAFILPSHSTSCADPSDQFVLLGAPVGVTFSPLPFALQELSAIQQLMASFQQRCIEVIEFSGNQFSEENLSTIQSLMEKSAVVHIATHSAAMLNKNYYELGGGVLMSNNFVLAASRIVKEGWNLSGCRLIVLALCDGVVGSVTLSRGLLGLSYACLAAGARAVVVAAYPVDDCATMGFMSKLYEQLVQGRSPAEALFNIRTCSREENETALAATSSSATAAIIANPSFTPASATSRSGVHRDTVYHNHPVKFVHPDKLFFVIGDGFQQIFNQKHGDEHKLSASM